MLWSTWKVNCFFCLLSVLLNRRLLSLNILTCEVVNNRLYSEAENPTYPCWTNKADRMVSALAHSTLMEISPGNTQPESFMRRTSTNASPLPNQPGLRDIAGLRDGTHGQWARLGLAQVPVGTGQAPCGEGWAPREAPRLVPRPSTVAAGEEQGWWSHTAGGCSDPWGERNRTGVSILGSQCCKSHPKTGTFGDISQGWVNNTNNWA